MMPSSLKQLNPHIKFYDVHSPEFAAFGRVITTLDTAEILSVAKNIQAPETGSAYQPSLEAFEKLAIAQTIQTEIFGTLPTQLGYCWGHNQFLNATEWHNGSEVNIAVTPLVLLLAHRWDVEEGKIVASAFTAFYLPAGTGIEVYETTLHFCPCEVDEAGFGCIVGLIKGTNTDLEIAPKDKLLFRKNKWLICHTDNFPLIEKGVFPGITGTNYQIQY